jgi:hypothetical protein
MHYFLNVNGKSNFAIASAALKGASLNDSTACGRGRYTLGVSGLFLFRFLDLHLSHALDGVS